MRMGNVTGVTGRVEETRGDTIRLTVSELRSEARGRAPFGRGRAPLLTLVADGTTRIKELAGHASAVERGAIGAALGFVAGFVALVLASRSS